MATVDIVFRGRDEASGIADDVREGLEGVGESAERSGSAFSGFFTGALSAATGFLALDVFTSIVGGVTEAAGALTGFVMESSQATRDLQAQLGITADEAENLSSVAEEVFVNNWGDSIGEASAMVASVHQQLGDLTDEALAEVTMGAAAIADTFDQEVPEVVNSIKAITDNFPGTTEAEALDFITAGFQRGLNSSDDFLDSIREYGVQFGEADATAGQFFSVLETGLQTGMLGTDKIADAFKESRIRITEVSDEVLEAFENIGQANFSQDLIDEFGTWQIDSEEVLDSIEDKLNNLGLDVELDPEKWVGPLTTVDEKTGEVVEQWRDAGDVLSSVIFQGLEDGSVSVAQAQEIAIGGLKDMDNQVQQNSAGVKIFGTMWEDLGADAFLAVDTTATALEDLEGSTDSLSVRYETLGAVFQSLQREALVALAPIGDVLLDIANVAAPLLIAGMEDLNPILTNIAGTIGTVAGAFQGLFGDVEEDAQRSFGTFSAEALGAENALTTSLQTMSAVLEGTGIVESAQGIWTSYSSLIETQVGIAQDVVETVMGFISEFIDQNGEDIVTFVGDAWESISSIVGSAVSIVQSLIVPVFDFISGYLQTHGDSIVQIMGGAWDIVSNVIGGALEVIEGLLSATVAVLEGDWQGAADAIRGIGEDLMNRLEGIFEGGLDIVMGLFDMWYDNVTGVFETLVDAAEDFGEFIVGGLQRGIESAWGSFTRWFTDLGEGLVDDFMSLWEIGSPSQVWADEVGEPAIQGILLGIERGLPDLRMALMQISEEALETFEGLAEAIENAIIVGFESTASVADRLSSSLDKASGIFDEVGGAQALADMRGRSAEIGSELTDIIREIADLQNEQGLQGDDEIARQERLAELMERRKDLSIEQRDLAEDISDEQFRQERLRLTEEATLNQIRRVREEAAGITDPEEARDYVDTYTQGILRIAELNKELINAETSDQRRLIQERLELEREAFEQRKQAQEARAEFEDTALDDAAERARDPLAELGAIPEGTRQILEVLLQILNEQRVARGKDVFSVNVNVTDVERAISRSVNDALANAGIRADTVIRTRGAN